MIAFTDVALEKLYVFGRSLNKKLPKRDHPDLQDVLASVDLDSFRVQRTHESLQLSLEAEDSEVEGIGSGVAIIRDPEQDFLSNIINALNDAYQTDFTTEDKVDIATISQKVHENEELRQVIEGDNTETNKRYKFEQVVDDILLGFVNSKLELYKKLSKQEVKADLKRQLYQAYLESTVRRRAKERLEKVGGADVPSAEPGNTWQFWTGNGTTPQLSVQGTAVNLGKRNHQIQCHLILQTPPSGEIFALYVYCYKYFFSLVFYC